RRPDGRRAAPPQRRPDCAWPTIRVRIRKIHPHRLCRRYRASEARSAALRRIAGGGSGAAGGAGVVVQNLAVQIVRFVDEDQPGWVASEFVDADGKCHTIIDKVPIFTEEDLGATSDYPRRGSAQCEVLAQWRDTRGRELVRITTARPCAIESTEGSVGVRSF